MPAEPPVSSQVSRLRPGRWRHRRNGRGRRALVLRSAIITTALAGAATLVGIALVPADGTASRVRAHGTATSQSPAVGALFTTRSGRLASHFCSASVVDSPSGDLVLTAAHCMRRHSPGPVVFVPGYAHGQAPYGIWTVTKVIEDHSWRSSSDPDDDFAFLIVRQAGNAAASVQDLTGAEAIGIGEPAGQRVTVTGYPSDLDAPISCGNDAVAFSPTQLEFRCDGYTNGTSGGPFLASVNSPGGAWVVIGVIGGYEEGGRTPSVSYAARFGARMAALYRTAVTEAGS